MFLVFVDECGYAANWRKEISKQPFHITAAVAIPSNILQDAYNRLRAALKRLSLPYTDVDTLGKGEEIKAAAVDRGDDFWRNHPSLRDAVRRAYLDQPEGITYLAVCIDKHKHLDQYGDYAKDPADLALKYLLERIQGFLSDRHKQGFVLIDSNKREERKQRNFLGRLLKHGSRGFAISQFWGTIYSWQLKMNNIVEIQFGDSKYSLGLQIADFVARHLYSWRKKGKPLDYPGWPLIEQKLYRYPEYLGWGYKEFPSDSMLGEQS